MNAHDRFESLAGAIALGEASARERATFEAHASTCARCNSDIGDGAFVVARIAQAHRSETWRPSQPIVERLRERRGNGARRTLGVLGWAVAVSLVLNVTLATGIGSQLRGAFSSVAAPPANVATTTIALEAPASAIVARPIPHRRHVSFATHAKKHAAKMAPKTIAAKVVPRRKASALPTLEEMPDVLVGLDLYGDGIHHTVAVQPLPRCPLPLDEQPDGRPCPDATGHVR